MNESIVMYLSVANTTINYAACGANPNQATLHPAVTLVIGMMIGVTLYYSALILVKWIRRRY